MAAVEGVKSSGPSGGRSSTQCSGGDVKGPAKLLFWFRRERSWIAVVVGTYFLIADGIATYWWREFWFLRASPTD